jgi:mRNA (2'-O-methyladenosine-N6-)-methyltransferase
VNQVAQNDLMFKTLYFVPIAGVDSLAPCRITRFPPFPSLNTSFMADEQFRNLVSDTLYSLFSSSRIHTPLGSLELLSTAIAADLGSTTVDSITPRQSRFRLTDRSRFECAIEVLAKHWDRGSISIIRDESGVTVTDVHLGSSSNAETTARVIGKRKRVRDEDADSAAGSGDEAEDAYEEELQKPCTTLATLSKELKEVYAFLQRSTAKGRLLAEQVCARMSLCNVLYPHFTTVPFPQALV